MSKLRITLLVDADAAIPELDTEHGLSLLIEAGEQVILFDAGATGAAFRNAERMGLAWQRVSRIVLSHGHIDHTGGLSPWLDALPDAHVYLHPRTLSPKWVIHPGASPRELTTPAEVQRRLWSRRDKLHWASAPMRLPGGIGLTGPILRRHTIEAPSDEFFLDSAGREGDSLEDELALWIPTESGLVVVIGCAHAGLANTLDHIRVYSGESRLAVLMGGLHMGKASESRLDFTRMVIEKARPERIVPLHCTGVRATEFLRQISPDRWMPCRAGEGLVL